jgi:hypothetical protein
MAGKPRGRPRRPSIYDAQVHKQIVDALKSGGYKTHAAHAAGISRECLDLWIEAGREGREPFVRFALECDRARAEDALRNQAIVSAAAVRKIEGDWKAAAWLLERKYPKLYGKRIADNVDDANGTAAADDEPGVHSPWLAVVK